MEADVNVLVVGSSAARRGAIGRHFPFPLIRRGRKPVRRRCLLRFLRADWASEVGGRPTELSRRSEVGRGGVFVCVCWRAGVNRPFLFINMAELNEQSRQSRSSSRLPLPSPTWRTQSDPSLARKRERDYCFSLAAVLGVIKKEEVLPTLPPPLL